MENDRILSENCKKCIKISDSARPVKKHKISVVTLEGLDLKFLDRVYGNNSVPEEQNLLIKYELDGPENKIDINLMIDKRTNCMDMVIVVSKYWF